MKYNLDQQLFCLSFMSNMVVGKRGDGSELTSNLNNILQSELLKPEAIALIGEWELVWGPGVYQFQSSKIADNVMFVARSKNQTPPRLVVAVAGTNGIPFLSYGWKMEDFNVKNTTPWPHALEGFSNPWIAEGTHIGVQTLLDLKPGGEARADGLTLMDFLSKQDWHAQELHITGHSLGGTLAPVLALWLSDHKPEWTDSTETDIQIYASAGTTPGNADFAAYYANRLGKTTKRIWNSLDVVPRAWNKELMDPLPDLYLPDLEPNRFIRWFFGWIQTFRGQNEYAQIIPSAPPLAGTFSPVKGWSTLERFLKEMLYQHVNEYVDLVGVGDFITLILPDNKALAKVLSIDISEKRIQALQAHYADLEA